MSASDSGLDPAPTEGVARGISLTSKGATRRRKTDLPPNVLNTFTAHTEQREAFKEARQERAPSPIGEGGGWRVQSWI